MRTILCALLFTAIIQLNCPGQDAASQSRSNAAAMTGTTPELAFSDWVHFATNNARAKELIQQKRDIDSQIAALRKRREESMAADHNTYANSPCVMADGNGNARSYQSRAAYDNETMIGLIKSSLNVNDEIIRLKAQYFAANGSNVVAQVEARLSPPVGLRVIGN